MQQAIKILIRKFILNQCTPDEIDTLVAYFQNHEINETFPEVEEVLDLLDEQEKLKLVDANRIYEHILEKAKAENKKRRSNYKKHLSWAALFIGIIGLGFYFTINRSQQEPEAAITKTEKAIQLETEDGRVLELNEDGQLQLTNTNGGVIGTQSNNTLVYENDENPSEEIAYNTLTIPYGKRFQVKLGDGSSVYMNSGSSLRYPINFPKTGKREVFLTGEAYFDIHKDPERPFIVTANELEVNVLGTRFNVSAYPEDNHTDVVLVSGSVNLSADKNDLPPITLEPGQMGKYRSITKKIDLKEVDTKLYTAWMKGEMVFRNESLTNILKRLERHYNITVINEEKELSHERFNATFLEETSDKILDYFHTIYGLDYNRKNDTIFIKPKPIKMNKTT